VKRNMILNNNSVSPLISLVIICFISITIICSIYILSYQPPDNKKNPNNAPNTIITSSFDNEEKTTNNNGGWKVTVIHISENITWDNITIVIKKDNGIIIERINVTDNSAFLTYKTENYTMWIFKSDGQPFFSNNNSRILLNTTNINELSTEEYMSLENITIALLLRNENNQYAKLGDTIYLYKDSNGDGINEISSGCEIIIQTPNKIIAGNNLE